LEWLENGFQDLKPFSIDWRRYENAVTATIPYWDDLIAERRQKKNTLRSVHRFMGPKKQISRLGYYNFAAPDFQVSPEIRTPRNNGKSNCVTNRASQDSAPSREVLQHALRSEILWDAVTRRRIL
jgi:hypothetical protein